MATHARRQRIICRPEDFQWAASEGLISSDQAATLWNGLRLRPKTRSRLDLANVAYYFGAMIVIGSMTFLMSLAWQQYGGQGMATIAAVYALCFTVAAGRLRAAGHTVPGGLLVTMAVCMVPLTIYGIERATGLAQTELGAYRDFYAWVSGSWFPMELSTLAAALLALRFVRFPFLTAPVAFVLWFMSIDITPLLFGSKSYSGNAAWWTSLVFGLIVLAVAYMVDSSTEESDGDFAFWLYLGGLISAMSGLAGLLWPGTIGVASFALLSAVLLPLSVALNRGTFAVAGALGVYASLCYLSAEIFAGSILFPFALTALGLSIIVLGVWYQRHEGTWTATARWISAR
jgi:hypothetical protein